MIPKPVEPCYSSIGSVYKDGSEELHAIYLGFKAAVKTGEAQTVNLDTGSYLMTPTIGGKWELFDTSKQRRYFQENVSKGTHHEGYNYDLVEEGDLFIWVIRADDTTGEDDLGYLHNQWVFVREQE